MNKTQLLIEKTGAQTLGCVLCLLKISGADKEEVKDLFIAAVDEFWDKDLNVFDEVTEKLKTLEDK